MAPQDSENCGRNFAKRKQSDAVFAGKRLLRMVIIDIMVINSTLGRLTLDPAGMHCPSWDDAFVSSLVTGLLWRTLYSVVNHSAVIAAQFTRRGCAKAARNTVELLPKNVISSSDFLLIVSV